jgi:hypothetical protein
MYAEPNGFDRQGRRVFLGLMKMKRFLLLLTVGYLVTSGYADGPSEFSLDKDKNGVKVYTRKIEGSSLKEFKGVTAIKTSLTSLVALMDDTDALPRWLHNCGAARLVQKINERERITYTTVKAPWPVSDRDTVSYSKIVQDPKSKIITIYLKGMPDRYPVQSGKVRVPSLKGFWQFIPNKNGYVTVIYQLHSEPGGAIPDALANSTATDIPYHTLLNMHKIVKEEKYQSAKLPQVKELN